MSIIWTRTASRVAGTTGEPCSSVPWWLRMMWRTAWAREGSKPGISSISRRTSVVAERDLALEAAGVGEVDRQRVVVVGLGLADVVQERAGHRDLAVDTGEEVGGGGDRLRDRDRVLEQPVAVGLVVDLRRRGVAEARPDLRALAEEAVEQGPSWGSCTVASSSRRSLSRRSSGTSELDREILRRVLPLLASRSSVSLIFGPHRSLTSKAPLTWTTAPGAASA